MLRLLSVIRHKSPRYNQASSKKAQHLRRCISLRTFTRGRLVPRQPRAIKSTTPTALHDERIYIAKYIHGNIDINSTPLHGRNIRNSGFIHGNAAIKPTALQGRNIHHGVFIHGNAAITPTALHHYNIRNGGFIHWNTGIKPTVLHRRNIHHGGSVLMRTAHDLTHFKPSFDPFHLVISAFLRDKMNEITAIVEFTWLTSQRLDCG